MEKGTVRLLGIGDNVSDQYVHKNTMYPGGQALNVAVFSRMQGAQTGFLDQEKETDELIYFSCTPWFDFTALTNEHKLDKDDTVPHLAWGRYYEEKGRLS